MVLPIFGVLAAGAMTVARGGFAAGRSLVRFGRRRDLDLDGAPTYYPTMDVDTSDFMRKTAVLGQRMPRAELDALNWTAMDILEELQGRMKVNFNRPTRFTLNAFHVWRATMANPVAAVQERPSAGRRHFLKVQERGGSRPITALERLISERVVSDQIIRAVVPTSAARLDAYGNWSSGERNQALSGIQAQRDRSANSTPISNARGARLGRASYFTPAHGGLSPGIWRRERGGALAKVATFTQSAPMYQPRLGFETVAEEVARARFARNMRRAMERATRNL